MMSRHDWAMVLLIGLSAFASGNLTYLAHQRLAEHRGHEIQGAAVVELDVELDSEGGFFFVPLKPRLKQPLVMEPRREFAFPPIRLKKGEGAMLDYRRREEIPLLFKGSVPSGLKSGEQPVYLFVPTGERVLPAAELRFRHPG